LPASEAAEPAAPARNVPLAQWAAIARVSLARTFNTKLFWSVVSLATLPVLLIGFITTMMLIEQGRSGQMESGGPQRLLDVMENLFAAAFVHFGLFFAAFTFGAQSTRDEIDEQTLHYFMLQPAERWLLPLGKFSAYLAFATPCFLLSLAAIQCLIAVPFGWETARSVYTSGDYLLRLGAQALATVAMLAVCGAVFMGLSSVLRNMFYGIALYGWELGVNFLPDTVKNFSITYHVKAILPFTSAHPDGAFAILSEGPGAVQTTLVLTLLLAGGLALACWRATRRECLYTVQ